jgi:hypothetical protein
MLKLGLKPKRIGDKERECIFTFDLLDQVAAILKPKRLPGPAQLTDEHREKLKPYAFQGRKTGQQQTQSGNGETPLG